MWRWVVYALLSRYAQHHVERIVIDTKVLDDDTVAVAKEILAASDPLTLLFETSLSQRSHGWLCVSRFYMALPDATRTGPPVVFESLVSIRVQTIETREGDGKKWWRVLFPGCGDAWVRDGDVQALVTEDSTGIPGSRTNTGRHLKFVDMTGTSKDTVLKVVRLAPHGIKVIEVSASDEVFPIDDWLNGVLSVCTQLEELILPRNADLHGHGEIVAAAEAGNIRLRRLTVDCVITGGNSPDVLDFLDVLCDPTHQLTSHVQELRLAVDLFNEPHDFAVRFRQLLETNRQIYSLWLLVYGAKFSVPTFEPVVIGGCPAPLDMRSKAALIGALSMHSSQLDSSVIGLIFSFAAQHRVRRVDVEFTGVFYREDY